MKLQTVIDAWNKQADEYNQWDSLSGEEMAEFAMGFMRARFLTYIAASELIHQSPFDADAVRKYNYAKQRALDILGVDERLENISL